jgi:hypothetical protein
MTADRMESCTMSTLLPLLEQPDHILTHNTLLRLKLRDEGWQYFHVAE